MSMFVRIWSNCALCKWTLTLMLTIRMLSVFKLLLTIVELVQMYIMYRNNYCALTAGLAYYNRSWWVLCSCLRVCCRFTAARCRVAWMWCSWCGSMTPRTLSWSRSTARRTALPPPSCTWPSPTTSSTAQTGQFTGLNSAGFLHQLSKERKQSTIFQHKQSCLGNFQFGKICLGI